MNKMTEDNCRMGDPKVMTNTKGAPYFGVQTSALHQSAKPFVLFFHG